MTSTVVLPVVIGGLYAAGVYLLTDRSLTRVLLGVLLLGNATNVLILSASGPAGKAPLVGSADPADMSDPLPQAMALTAVVITFGISAFLLALIYRSWRLVRQEIVLVDEEDRRVAARTPRHADALDPDEIDPVDLAPADRVGGVDAVGPPDVEDVLRRRFPDAASDDVALPPTRRRRR